MKIYLDDLRDPPDGSWTLIRDPDVAISLLLNGGVTDLSLDHDLGEGVKSGSEVFEVVEQAVYLEEGYLGRSPPRVYIHSANSVGCRDIESGLRRMRERLGVDLWRRHPGQIASYGFGG